MTTTYNISALREQYNMSQQDLAERLGMSRPTLSKVEQGERQLTLPERHKIDEIFSVVHSVESQDPDIRISIPQKNIEKFKQALLYILQKVGSKPNVGMTVLYKLLYFADFDYYEKYEEQFMGLTYIRNHHGPTPKEFVTVVEDMQKKGQIEMVKSKYFTYEQKKFLPVVEPNLALLNGRELAMIDNVLDRYAHKSATELSEFSHTDTPWMVADVGEELHYESVFYRDTDHSVRAYEDAL